jgi:hypothetical protein
MRENGPREDRLDQELEAYLEPPVDRNPALVGVQFDWVEQLKALTAALRPLLNAWATP